MSHGGSLMPFIVAIDGLAASGKGTIARGIAKKFGFHHLDTGLIYRAVAVLAKKAGKGKLSDSNALNIAKNFTPECLDLQGLRTNEAGINASQVAKNLEIRRHLINFQRNFAKYEPGAVIDGRDIGTVICPDAQIKIFVTAALSCRAERRYNETRRIESDIALSTIKEDLAKRDEKDINRKISPLRLSQDAHLIDTTELSIEAAIGKAIELVKSKK